MAYEHASNSMMGAEGFGSESFNDAGELVVGNSGGSNTPGAGLSSQGFLKRGRSDPKEMLELGKESEKLKAMTRIVEAMAQGTDQSEYFPSVVKCVACKDLELKKLVYMYLVRYAEEVPDLALLSISTFQKGLSDPNQLIRASALRVLSSIRVPVIVPIMQIALKQAASDMSPYVRKTAAHALPKLNELAPTEKEHVIETLERLLHDRTTLVLGSVVMAFEEICPDRLDLLHKHFRKMCNMLVDIDEWGQTAIIHLLTRYARTQFLDPNGGVTANEVVEESFYGDEADKDSDSDEEEGKPKRVGMDPDHRLFLRSLLPLLMSRNAGVVMAVAHAYHYLAPHSEVSLVAKAMIRLIKGNREAQYIVLTAVASMAQSRKGIFEPYLKSFFVEYSDPTFVRLIKLEILTTLANESNISSILREFQEYVKHPDREFVTQTIQCIGRCASSLSNVTESCLTGLLALMRNKDEAIVAESVVVIKKLLQQNPESHKDVIIMMSKMTSTIHVPMARASILWLIGEYSSHVPKIAPDVLRQMAKTFPEEEPIVKMQIINLSAKLYVTNTKQVKLLTQYVLNLAKYDLNYDLRDRARLIRALLFTKDTKLHRKSKKLFLSEKPAPSLRSTFDDRARYQVGTMSHVLNQECVGWTELPAFPEEAPDASVRTIEEKPLWAAEETPAKDFSFYSNSDESESEDSESESDSDSESGSGSSGSSGESSSGEETESEEEPAAPVVRKNTFEDVSDDSFSDTDSSSDEESKGSGSDDDSDDDEDKAEPVAINTGEEEPEDDEAAQAAAAPSAGAIDLSSMFGAAPVKTAAPEEVTAEAVESTEDAKQAEQADDAADVGSADSADNEGAAPEEEHGEDHASPEAGAVVDGEEAEDDDEGEQGQDAEQSSA